MKVSVITPFYNTEAYLAEAIESVLAQTYQDFEYLLVNNRSTDRSLEIAEEYARRDPRIRIVTNTDFLEQDMNFSEGFRLMSPESRYAKMVLADDWIFPRCLEQMVAVAEAHPTVGIVSSYSLKGVTLLGHGLPYPSQFLPGRTAARTQLLENLFFFGSPTTVMFRSEVVRKVFPFYDPAVPHADTEAGYRTLKEWDFGFVHQVLSFIRTENESRMKSVRDYFPEMLDKYIVVVKFGRDFLEADEYPAVYQRIRKLYFRQLAAAALRGPNPGLWKYHREGLATIGYDLHRWKLWPYIGAELLDLVFNPKKTLGKLISGNPSRTQP
jgi:glycosyltransferase involved in cell wall biosynthesis